MALYNNFNEYLDGENLPKKGRILGLDVGAKYVGISLSDERAVIASPFKYYERRSFQKDSDYFKSIIQDYKAVLIIAGLPLNLDGSMSKQGENVTTFIDKISAFLDVDIVYWDERFSTMAVERAMLEHDMSRKKRENNIDKLAATYILQGALDFLNHKKSL